MTRALTLESAVEACNRWLAHCDRQRDQARALAELASLVRRGEIDAKEARRRQIQITGFGSTVHDGADLESAVRMILDHIGAKP